MTINFSDAWASLLVVTVIVLVACAVAWFRRAGGRFHPLLTGAFVLTLFALCAELAFGALFFVGLGPSPWSDEPGRQLAARLQGVGSPLIRDVVFRPQTTIDPPEVHVIVQAGVTEAQAEQLWCEVVAPAGGSQFEGELGALIYDDAGNWLASNVTCPSGAPSPS
ncbi:MAG: hypothetical protein H0T54_06830 [Geodermatophilaceae bacterium]|nr:hypothetical protein [Geodermatophilaceae bacterium]